MLVGKHGSDLMVPRIAMMKGVAAGGDGGIRARRKRAKTYQLIR
jgi:hypothetical protein